MPALLDLPMGALRDEMIYLLNFGKRWDAFGLEKPLLRK